MKASNIYAAVGPDDIIIEKGSKKAMLRKVKALNQTKPGHYLGNTPSKKAGDKFK